MEDKMVTRTFGYAADYEWDDPFDTKHANRTVFIRQLHSEMRSQGTLLASTKY